MKYDYIDMATNRSLLIYGVLLAVIMILMVFSGVARCHTLMCAFGIVGVAVVVSPLFLLVFGTDRYNVSMINEHMSGCPYCGSKCIHVIIDDRPFAKSKIVYSCTTVMYTRKTRYKVQRSDICKIVADNQCDTI